MNKINLIWWIPVHIAVWVALVGAIFHTTLALNILLGYSWFMILATVAVIFGLAHGGKFPKYEPTWWQLTAIYLGRIQGFSVAFAMIALGNIFTGVLMFLALIALIGLRNAKEFTE